METEPPRLAMALAALGGAIVWGTYTLVMAMNAGVAVGSRDFGRALINVAAAILVGVVVAWFLGPALAAHIHVSTFKAPEVVGFAIGFFAFEAVPSALKALRGKAKALAREKGR